MTPELRPLQALIASLGLKMDAVFIPRSKTPNATETKLHKMQIHWSVKLTREGRNAELTSPYHQGIGHLPKALRPKDLGRVTKRHAERIEQALERGKYSSVGSTYGSKPLPPPAIADVLFCLAYHTCLYIGLALRRLLTDVELAALREAFQDY